MKSAQLEFTFQVSVSVEEIPAPTPRTPRAPFQRSEPPTRHSPPPIPLLRSGAEELHAELVGRTGLHIQLHITDNRSTLMSVKYSNNGRAARVGLHHMFLLAEGPMLEALAHWVKHPRSSKNAKAINAFLRANNHLVKPKKPRPATLHTQGVVYDLQRLFDEVNAAHFEGRVDSGITWGKMPAQRRRRSIRFGSYSPAEHLVRMHPLLDSASVPEFFVRYIVFHEMLHADLGIEEGEGRRVIHSRAFRERERLYPDFRAAEAWMEDRGNLAMLLGRTRSKAKH